MNETDLSDEALKAEFDRRYEGYGQEFEAKDITFFAGWEECRRRAEVMLETQANQHIETLAKAMADNVRLIIEKKKLEELLEKERREAFTEAAWQGYCMATDLGRRMTKADIDEAYHAFLKEREK